MLKQANNHSKSDITDINIIDTNMAKKNNYVKINVEKIEINKNGYCLFFRTLDEKHKLRRLRPILIEDMAAYYIKNKLSDNPVGNSIYDVTYNMMVASRIELKNVYIVSTHSLNDKMSYNVIIETYNNNDQTKEKYVSKIDDATALFLSFFSNDEYHILIEEKIFIETSIVVSPNTKTLTLVETFKESEKNLIETLESELQNALNVEDYIKAQKISEKISTLKENDGR